MAKRILVIAAHPDDEVFGCGATISRLSAEGAKVHIAILGEGATSRSNHREDASTDLVSRLQKNLKEAANIIGAQTVSTHGFPDNRFDSVDLLEIVKIVEKLVEDHKPELIFTHHIGDLNIDHQLTSRAVMTATRPLKGQVVREVLAFEIPSSTEWAFQRIEPIFRPDTFFDVSEVVENKIRAMSVYESESRPYPHPRSPQALRAIASRWGSVVGCAAAEAFEVIRSIR